MQQLLSTDGSSRTAAAQAARAIVRESRRYEMFIR